jgi:hypothetical protein
LTRIGSPRTTALRPTMDETSTVDSIVAPESTIESRTIASSTVTPSPMLVFGPMTELLTFAVGAM